MSAKVKWSDVPSEYWRAKSQAAQCHANISLPDNTNPRWYKDAGLRHNVALGLGLCLVISTNVGSFVSSLSNLYRLANADFRDVRNDGILF
jgi:hypothetical protein